MCYLEQRARAGARVITIATTSPEEWCLDICSGKDETTLFLLGVCATSLVGTLAFVQFFLGV